MVVAMSDVRAAVLSTAGAGLEKVARRVAASVLPLVLPALDGPPLRAGSIAAFAAMVGAVVAGDTAVAVAGGEPAATAVGGAVVVAGVVVVDDAVAVAVAVATSAGVAGAGRLLAAGVASVPVWVGGDDTGSGACDSASEADAGLAVVASLVFAAASGGVAGGDRLAGAGRLLAAGVASVAVWLGGGASSGACDWELTPPVETGAAAVVSPAVATTIGGVAGGDRLAGADRLVAAGAAGAAVWLCGGDTGTGVCDCELAASAETGVAAVVSPAVATTIGGVAGGDRLAGADRLVAAVVTGAAVWLGRGDTGSGA
jgi:hypothetical protein